VVACARAKQRGEVQAHEDPFPGSSPARALWYGGQRRTTGFWPAPAATPRSRMGMSLHD
jgi:hypothetical protein